MTGPDPLWGGFAGSPDLQTSLTDLAGLVSGGISLDGLLAQVASFAAHAIPGADGAGVTLLRVDRPDNRVDALAASTPSWRRSTRSSTSP